MLQPPQRPRPARVRRGRAVVRTRRLLPGALPGALPAALVAALVAATVVPAPVTSAPDHARAGAAAAVTPAPWPGPSSTRVVDRRAYFGTDVSGLDLRVGARPADDVLWAVDDRAGLLLRLVQRDGVWVRDPANGWAAGKQVTFADGRRPDVEGVVVVDGWAYLATERDETGVARPSIVRVPTSGTATRLTADREWRLGRDFPGLGANVGFEAVSFVPDAFLVAGAFRDERTGRAFNPAAHPDRVGGGLFLVAAEAARYSGTVHVYALPRDGSAVRVASVANPLGLVMDLAFDRSTGTLWMACDDDCQGRVAVARLRPNGDGTTSFVAYVVHRRSAGLPDHNNEGFTVAPTSRCVDGVRPVLWSNDANDGGHVLRRGVLSCGGGANVADGPAGPAPEPVPVAVAVSAPRVRVGAAVRISVRVRAAGGSGGLAPDGDVRVTVGSRSATGTLVDGRAVVRLPAFRGAGRRTVTVRYTGDAEHRAATARTTLEVRRARTRLTTGRTRVTVRAPRRARVAVRLRSAVGTPGTVRARLDGRRVRVVRRGTRFVVRTPVLRRPGTRTLTVRYGGSRSTEPARLRLRLRVR